jgi:hypothetical protein
MRCVASLDLRARDVEIGGAAEHQSGTAALGRKHRARATGQSCTAWRLQLSSHSLRRLTEALSVLERKVFLITRLSRPPAFTILMKCWRENLAHDAGGRTRHALGAWVWASSCHFHITVSWLCRRMK